MPGLEYSGKFEVSEDARFVILSTGALDAKVNKESGEVAFLDKNGLAILRENEGGGKTFTPIEVEETKGYTLHCLKQELRDPVGQLLTEQIR